MTLTIGMIAHLAHEVNREAEALARELTERKDGAYRERDRCVALLARMAAALGFRVGIGPHTGEDWGPEWKSVVYIDLPSGQVSWHFPESEREWFAFLPPYPGAWDGHTTEEKYRRVLEAAF